MNIENPIPIVKVVQQKPLPICADKDEDCKDVKDKVRCWMHQPEEGLCPYLNGNKK